MVRGNNNTSNMDMSPIIIEAVVNQTVLLVFSENQEVLLVIVNFRQGYQTMSFSKVGVIQTLKFPNQVANESTSRVCKS